MSKAADLFPDIHFKMSKKIAQLTKVIYQLNSKNEDHQVRSRFINTLTDFMDVGGTGSSGFESYARDATDPS